LDRLGNSENEKKMVKKWNLFFKLLFLSSITYFSYCFTKFFNALMDVITK